MSAIDKYSQVIDIGIPVGLGYAAGSMFGYGPHGALAGVAYYFVKGPLMPAIKPSSTEDASPAQQLQQLQSRADKKPSVSEMAKSKYDLYKQQIDNAPFVKPEKTKTAVLYDVPKIDKTPAKNIKPAVIYTSTVNVPDMIKQRNPFKWNGRPISTTVAKTPFDRRDLVRFINTPSAPESYKSYNAKKIVQPNGQWGTVASSRHWIMKKDQQYEFHSHLNKLKR